MSADVVAAAVYAGASVIFATVSVIATMVCRSFLLEARRLHASSSAMLDEILKAAKSRDGGS